MFQITTTKSSHRPKGIYKGGKDIEKRKATKKKQKNEKMTIDQMKEISQGKKEKIMSWCIIGHTLLRALEVHL